MKRNFDDMEEKYDFVQEKNFCVRDNKDMADINDFAYCEGEIEEQDEDEEEYEYEYEEYEDEYEDEEEIGTDREVAIPDYPDRTHVIVIIEDSLIRPTPEGACPLQKLLVQKFTDQRTLFKQWYTDMVDFIDRRPFLFPYEYSTILRKYRKEKSVSVRQIDLTVPICKFGTPPAIAIGAGRANSSNGADQTLIEFDINNPSLVADKDWVLNAVQKDPRVYKFASNKVKLDMEIVFKTLERDGSLFEYLPRILRYDREIVKFALQYDGDALLTTSRELRMDRELASMSLKHTLKALDYFIWKKEDDFLSLVEEALNSKSQDQLKGIKLTRDQTCKLARKYPFLITLVEDDYPYDKELICNFLKQSNDNYLHLPNAEYHIRLVLDDQTLMRNLLRMDNFIRMFRKILIHHYVGKDNQVVYDILKRDPKLKLHEVGGLLLDGIMLSYLSFEEQRNYVQENQSLFSKHCTKELNLVQGTEALENRFEIRYPGLVVPYSMFEIGPPPYHDRFDPYNYLD